MKKIIDARVSYMVGVLQKKLTKEEFWRFYLLMDSDSPAGQFYCAVADKAIELCPEHFSNRDEEKVEI